MANTINFPITKPTVSALGSAEVIAKGSNAYTAIWGLGTLDTDWSLWNDFPTVVRFGNFVWCLWGRSGNHTYWRLIDVVIDTDDPNQFGGNIAYPVISNAQAESITNVQSGPLTDPATQNTDLSAGPYRPLDIENDVAQTSTAVPGFEGTYRYKEIIPNLNGGTIESFNITTNNSSISNRPRVRGWGDYSDAKGTSGDTTYGRFPPFATREQFESVYTNEWKWQQPDANTRQWLFAAEPGTTLTSTVLYSTANPTLTYPFTVETMLPNSLYRDIPGDNTGNGINDTPSSDDALLKIATAKALVPELDAAAKCIGIDFDIDIKLPDIDMASINNAINNVKASVSSAVSSTGLLEIANAAEGLKDRLLEGLPELPEFPNLAAELAKLNPLDSAAVTEFVNRWESVYSGVQGIIDNLSNFDVCSIVDVKAKVGEDGELLEKPSVPDIPEKDIEEPTQNVSVPLNSHNLPQTDDQADRGISPETTINSMKAYNDAWRLVEKSAAYSQYLDGEAENISKLSALEARPEHQSVVSGADRTAAAAGILFEPNADINLPPYIPGISSRPNVGLGSLLPPSPDFRNDSSNAGVVVVPPTPGNPFGLQRVDSPDPEPDEQFGQFGDNFINPNRVNIPPKTEVLTGEDIVKAEKEVFAPLYISRSIKTAISKARKEITAKLMASTVTGIEPDTDPTRLWSPPPLVDIGAPYPSFAGRSASIISKFDVETRDIIIQQYVEINKAIKEHVFTTEILSAAEDMVIGKASPYTQKNPTNVRSSGAPGSSGSRSVEGDPGIEKAVYSGGRAQAPESGEVIYASYFKGQIRNQLIQQSLMDILIATANSGPGYSMTIVSGGQDYEGKGTRRTGSIRHDGGFAADITIYDKNGRRLSGASRNSKDQKAMQELVKHFKANGITSIGAGPGYMGGNWHVDISRASYKGTWGRSHGNASTPSWLRSSFYS